MLFIYLYKRLPQLALYTILVVTHALPDNWKIKMLHPTAFHISGATLVLIGTLLYASLRLYKLKYAKPPVEVDEEDIVGSVNKDTDEQNWSHRFKKQITNWRSWVI